jgi:hypothetical protein
MIYHFELQPTVWHAKPWIFDWDDEAGEVYGIDSEAIIAEAAMGGASCHPCPMWSHKFSSNPLKSKTDMAAIIGWEHRLPDELVEFYPKLPDDGIPDVSYVNADGISVLGRDMIDY